MRLSLTSGSKLSKASRRMLLVFDWKVFVGKSWSFCDLAFLQEFVPFSQSSKSCLLFDHHLIVLQRSPQDLTVLLGDPAELLA